MMEIVIPAMRVIAGHWRRRILLRPPERITRPMPDRVKEAIFSMLGTRYATPGALPPLHVGDLFAGSGAMGIEALSRGAADCVFVERNVTARATLNENLIALGGDANAKILAEDAWQFELCRDNRAFDLVFLDPPYRDVQDTSADGPLGRLLARWTGMETGGCLIVFHHPKRLDYSRAVPEPWSIVDVRGLGTSGVTLIEKPGSGKNEDTDSA